MPPVLTFNSALVVWGIGRVGRSGPLAPCLLEQSQQSIKRRYRELARAIHPDKQQGGGAAAGAAASGGSSGSEEEDKPDLDWLRAARDMLLDELAAEQELDRLRLAEVQRNERQRQLAAAANLLVQLADRRQECGKQWGVPAAGIQLHFSRQERRLEQSTCHHLGVTLSSSGSGSVTALVTKSGYLLDEPSGLGRLLLTSQSFAPELLSLQQACDTRGWRLQQASGGSLCVRVGGHHSACVTAQQLTDGSATVAVLQAALDAEPALPARAARTAGTAGSAPAPATAARRERGLGSTASQHAPASGAASHKRSTAPTAAQRMMQTAAASAAAAATGELVRDVPVNKSFLSHLNFSVGSHKGAPKLLGAEWDGQMEMLLSAEDTQGRQYTLRVKVSDELVRQLYPIKKFRVYFPRTLLLNNEVRLGQRLQIWRTAAGGLLLKFLDPEPATESSGSGSSGAGGSMQHSTGSKRARRE